MPAYPKLIKQGVFWVSVPKWGKLIKLAQKEENSGSFGGKVQKKIEKKNPNLINMRYLIITQGGFFSQK